MDITSQNNESVKKEKIKDFTNIITKNNIIDQEDYTKYNVKRGLRNSDGSGVLVGLTKISRVVGFEKVDEEVIPVQGILEYRGMHVKDIINNITEEKIHGFDKVAYLLLFGQMPNTEHLEAFSALIKTDRQLTKDFTENVIMKSKGKNIMNLLAKSVLSLYDYDDNPDDISINNLISQSINLIAKFPTIIAYSYHNLRHIMHNDSLVIHYPDPNLTTAENFLYMLRKDGKFTKTEADVLDICLILHMEHGGGNNSSFTTHVISSSQTDTYSAIAGAIGSLKGPLHGGANISVMEMMEDIKKNVSDWTDKKELNEYIKKMLKGEAYDKSGKIYGFGHAVYTKSDPRAIILKERAKELAIEKDRLREFELYTLMEELVPKIFSEIKGKKVISPNVDFYSGFVYDCLNIPKEVYTAIFAMARIAGWTAHRIEELTCSKRIIRPAYKYV